MDDKKKELAIFNSVKCTYLNLPYEGQRLKLEFDNTDKSVIKNMLETAKPNLTDSKFPDFVCNNGFIEHFCITTAKEDKKGSDFKIESHNFELESKVKKENFLNDKQRNDKVNTIVSLDQESIYKDGSYSNFVNSFKKNFLKHVSSYKKYNGNKKLSCFLVELTGPNLVHLLKNGKGIIYRLSLDNEILKFLKYYSNLIHYVIYVHYDRYEIIDLEKLDKIIINNKCIYNWTSGRTIMSDLTCIFNN